MGWMRESIAVVRDLLPDFVRHYVEHEAFVWILTANVGAAIALFAVFGADADTVKEFGSFWALAALCLSVAEFDVVQKLAGRETHSSAGSWVIMLSILAFAWVVGAWAHSERVSAERSAEASRQAMEEIATLSHDPKVQEGMRMLAQIRERRAATHPASSPATAP